MAAKLNDQECTHSTFRAGTALVRTLVDDWIAKVNETLEEADVLAEFSPEPFQLSVVGDDGLLTAVGSEDLAHATLEDVRGGGPPGLMLVMEPAFSRNSIRISP